MTQKVAQELGLNKNVPFVDIQEKIKNKSFIAKKAVTFSEEKKVSNRRLNESSNYWCRRFSRSTSSELPFG